MSDELAVVPIADDLVVADDGDAADLTPDEAEAITTRIRRWANSFPVEDVVAAFRGRIWVALAYDSWAEWCECELGGLKLPVPQRREVVSELGGEGMSNRAIADTIGWDRKTVDRDAAASGSNVPVDEDRKTLGQDGRKRRQPKPSAPEPEAEIVDAEIVERTDTPSDSGPTTPETQWSRTVQNVSARIEMKDLTDEQVREVQGAAEFLLNYCRGELKIRENKK